MILDVSISQQTYNNLKFNVEKIPFKDLMNLNFMNFSVIKNLLDGTENNSWFKMAEQETLENMMTWEVEYK
jgi:hypothetical protein